MRRPCWIASTNYWSVPLICNQTICTDISNGDFFQLVTLKARFIFKDSNIFYKLVMHSVLFFLRKFISRILYYKQYSEIYILKGSTCFIQLSMSHIAVRLYKYILAVSLYYEVYFYYRWHSIARTLISRSELTVPMFFSF